MISVCVAGKSPVIFSPAFRGKTLNFRRFLFLTILVLGLCVLPWASGRREQTHFRYEGTITPGEEPSFKPEVRWAFGTLSGVRFGFGQTQIGLDPLSKRWVAAELDLSGVQGRRAVLGQKGSIFQWTRSGVNLGMEIHYRWLFLESGWVNYTWSTELIRMYDGAASFVRERTQAWRDTEKVDASTYDEVNQALDSGRERIKSYQSQGLQGPWVAQGWAPFLKIGLSIPIH